MSAVIDLLLAADVRPFTIAAAIVAALAIIELLSTVVGFSLSHVVGKDVEVEADGHSAISGMFLWINAGRVPLLILLMLTLGIFSVAGFSIQAIAHSIGISLPASFAAVGAIFGTIPAVRVTSRAIARLIPRDETYAVDDADFVGQIAVVAIGPLDQGLPGRVRLKDVFGNWHSVPARAGPDSNELAVGTSVLLVGRDTKSFIAIAAPTKLVAQQ